MTIIIFKSFLGFKYAPIYGNNHNVFKPIMLDIFFLLKITLDFLLLLKMKKVTT